MMAAMVHSEDQAQPWNSPVGPRTFAHAIGWLDLGPDDTLLDVGCGVGEHLALALERWPCRGVGVDPDGAALERARGRLAFAADRVRLQDRSMAEAELGAERLAAALCIGSSHAFGDMEVPESCLPACLETLAGLLQPSGWLLLGEAFWRRKPDAAYLETTGMQAAELRLESDLFALFARHGYEAVLSVRSSDTEWDLFEGASCARSEAAAHAAPDDAAAQATWARKLWRDAYLRWGRTTMGFGTYLLRAPAG